MSAIFLSDVHLIDSQSAKTRGVLQFIKNRGSKVDELYILGDLFDVWPSTTKFLIQNYRPVLEVLRDLKDRGVKIHYFEGNHDFHLGGYFRDELGISVYPNEGTRRFGNKHVYIAHGDLGNQKAYGYRLLRYFLRLSIVKTLICTLPSRWIFQMGRRSSQMSRRVQRKVKTQDEKIRWIYRKNAERIFKQGFDVVLMGHTHLPDDYRVSIGGRVCRYLNTGDWVSHFSYVEFDGTEFYTRTHPLIRNS